MIMGAIAFYSSLVVRAASRTPTHLGGLLVGYLYLKGARMHPSAEVKYRYLRWKMNRTRKKFDVYSGGRANDWDRASTRRRSEGFARTSAVIRRLPGLEPVPADGLNTSSSKVSSSASA